MNQELDKLLNGQCRHYSKGDNTLSVSRIDELRRLTPKWQFCANDNVLCRTFHFKTYAATIDFVKQVADIAEAQDHHPELAVSYKRCKVNYKTHTVNGITENEFICAALIDALATQ